VTLTSKELEAQLPVAPMEAFILKSTLLLRVVANIGLDTNWCGHDFAQANWYAFGRLAWNDNLRSEQIADEWIKQTFYPAASEKTGSPLYSSDWRENFLAPVKKMMLESREAAVNYMMPLGFHHIMSANGHYGPGPWWGPKNVRPDWTPTILSPGQNQWRWI